jgi:hypothetical protein
MNAKTFAIINSVSIAITLTVAGISIAAIGFTGFYPAIIVLCCIALVPVASMIFSRRMSSESNRTLIAVLNVICILVVLWMTFVIVHDRVLQDCC